MLALLFSSGSAKVITRQNYGVLFTTIGEADIKEEMWRHTFKLELFHNVWNKSMTPTVMLHDDLKELQKIRNCTRYNYEHFKHEIEQLLPDSNANSRNKKGLLNFVGKLSENLFGTATEEDVSELKDHIELLTNRTNLMTKEFRASNKEFSSFMTTANDRMTNIMKAVNDNNHMIDELSKNFFTSLGHLTKRHHKLISLVAHEVHAASVIQSEMDKMLGGIRDLIRHKLSFDLVPPKFMIKTIEHISGLLASRYPSYHIASEQLQYFYDTLDILYARKGDELYIHVKFPITSEESVFQIFHINSFPIPLNETSNHLTRLSQIPPYLAVSKDGQSFTHINQFQLDKCKGRWRKHCPDTLIPFNRNKLSCSAAIFIDDAALIKSLCKFKFQRDSLSSQVFVIEKSKLLLIAVKKITISCYAQPPQELPGCAFCVIDRKCRCYTEIDDISLPSPITNCANEDISIAHAINLALLNEFFDDHELNKISGDTVYESPPNVILPDFKFLQHDFHKVVTNDERIDLDLAKVANNAKQKEMIYENLAEPIIHHWHHSQNIFSWTNILLIVTSTLAVVSIIAFILLLIKVRNMAVAILLLQQASKAASQITGPYFRWNNDEMADITPTNSQSSCDEYSTLYLTMWIVTSMVLFIVLLIWIYRKFRLQTVFMVEICDGKHAIIIPVMTLTMPPSYWSVTSENAKIENMSVKYLNVDITWADVDIRNTWYDITLTPPTRTTLNPINAYLVQKIISNKYQAFMLFEYKGTTTYIHNKS